MVDAIPALTTEKAIKLFKEFGIYTEAELVSREEVEYEQYSKVINIEARAMINISGKQIIPAVIHYTTRLAGGIGSEGTSAACVEAAFGYGAGATEAAAGCRAVWSGGGCREEGTFIPRYDRAGYAGTAYTGR